jgi:uncharacterized protein
VFSSVWNWILSALHSAGPGLAYATLLMLMAAGLFLNILGLPGLWLIVISVVVYGWIFGWTYVGVWTIAVLVVLGLLAELVELLAGAAGSKAAGGSKRGMIGAIVGGIIGGIAGTPLIPIPVVGTIVGSVAGCFIGAYAIEWAIGRTHGDAAVISYGAAKGRIVGLLAKTAFGVVMAIWAAVAAIPIVWGAPIVVLPSTTLPTTTMPATAP